MAEWYWRPGNATREPNNAVISLNSPVYDVGLQERHSNIRVSHIRVDTPIGRIVGLGLFATPCRSYVRNISLHHVTIRHPQQWLHTNQSAPSIPGDNFLVALGQNSMDTITFDGVAVAGKAVKAHSDWGMVADGNVTNICYT